MKFTVPGGESETWADGGEADAGQVLTKILAPGETEEIPGESNAYYMYDNPPGENFKVHFFFSWEGDAPF
jgi:hypothetical protein